MQYDFALTPLGGQIINAKGRFFKYRAGVGMIRVKLTDGAVIDLLPGQGVSNRNFETIEITDRSGAANSGTILAGDFDFRDERITGDVNVIDNAKNKVMLGNCFYRLRSAPALAANYSFVQLFNPVGSGVNVSLNRIFFASDQVGTIGMFQSTVEAGGVTYPANKRIGGADGLLHCNSGYTVSQPGSGSMGTLNASVANVYSEIGINDPIVLVPGQGLLLQSSQLNVGTYVSVDCEQF